MMCRITLSLRKDDASHVGGESYGGFSTMRFATPGAHKTVGHDCGQRVQFEMNIVSRQTWEEGTMSDRYMQTANISSQDDLETGISSTSSSASDQSRR